MAVLAHEHQRRSAHPAASPGPLRRGRFFMIAVDFMLHLHKIHRDHEGSQNTSKIKLAL